MEKCGRYMYKSLVTFDPTAGRAEEMGKFKQSLNCVQGVILKGICDGAAAVVVADEHSVRKHSLKPLARIVAWSVVGCDPSVMGFGPVPAIKRLLKATEVDLNKIDLIEVNIKFLSKPSKSFYFELCEQVMIVDKCSGQKDLGLMWQTCSSISATLRAPH